MLPLDKQEQIAILVIRILRQRFESFPGDASSNKNTPFHEAFLQAFSNRLAPVFLGEIPYFISLASWLHGLTTSLGQTFFEGVAHILSDGTKKEFSGKDLRISLEQRNGISQLITDLKNRNRTPNLEDETKMLSAGRQKDFVEGTDFTADNWIETKRYVEAIELKTVRPNASIARDEKLKILSAKAALRQMYPDKAIYYFIGFPFDPFYASATGYDKTRFVQNLVEFEKYFDHREILLADELWNHLSSDTNTMQQILDIINAIATTQFMEDFQFLSEVHNHTNDRGRYSALLSKWRLFRERQLMDRSDQLSVIIQSRSRLEKVYYQPIFKNGGKEVGEYNEKRCIRLLEALDVPSQLL